MPEAKFAGQRAQTELVRELVTTAADDQNRDPQIGRTLFSLLIPPEIEPYLVGSGEMQMQLDTGTARIPWELLDAGAGGAPDGLPWALRVKLLRKLRTAAFREVVVDADADDGVLVIGEPACTEGYARLYGARTEAIAVRDCLTGPNGLDRDLVTALISDDPSKVGADARTVVNAVFAQAWRIVHIAGHGAVPKAGKPGGVVLSNGSVLGPDEIASMRSVPELVFVNCCHLASGDPDKLLKAPTHDRAGFASGVADALIGIGVRCVVAAGWAVDDDAASVFAESFYAALLRGSRFIDAVGEARLAAYRARADVNTWAAYRCYGDPDWVFRRKAADPNRPAAEKADYSFVASTAMLQLELERIAVECRWQGADQTVQRDRLKVLVERFAGRWGARGSVAERFGEAFVEAGDLENGMTWYERAVAATDGSASMRAAEQLANISGRLAWELVDGADRRRLSLRERRSRGGSTKADLAARRSLTQAEQTFRQAVTRAEELLQHASGVLATLNSLEQTVERLSLVGSVHKRRALVEIAAGRQSAQAALRRMLSSYQQARETGERTGAADLFYPASNCLAAEVATNGGRRGWRGPDPKIVDVVRRSLNEKNAGHADFWSVVGEIELRQYEALAKGRLSTSLDALAKDYQALYIRTKAPRMWSSVYDTASLVLASYARRAPGKERTAAIALLAVVRRCAHPEPGRESLG